MLLGQGAGKGKVKAEASRPSEALGQSESERGVLAAKGAGQNEA